MSASSSSCCSCASLSAEVRRLEAERDKADRAEFGMALYIKREFRRGVLGVAVNVPDGVTFYRFTEADADAVLSRQGVTGYRPASEPATSEPLGANAGERPAPDYPSAESRLSTLVAGVQQLEQEMGISARDLAVMSDDSNHNAQAAARAILGWLDRLTALRIAAAGVASQGAQK